MVAVETLRVKAYLVVLRNQVRDYLDVVALAQRCGLPVAVEALIGIDDYYVDRSREPDSVLTALVLWTTPRKDSDYSADGESHGVPAAGH